MSKKEEKTKEEKTFWEAWREFLKKKEQEEQEAQAKNSERQRRLNESTILEEFQTWSRKAAINSILGLGYVIRKFNEGHKTMPILQWKNLSRATWPQSPGYVAGQNPFESDPDFRKARETKGLSVTMDNNDNINETLDEVSMDNILGPKLEAAWRKGHKKPEGPAWSNNNTEDSLTKENPNNITGGPAWPKAAQIQHKLESSQQISSTPSWGPNSQNPTTKANSKATGPAWGPK